jgi:hypothetical protein
MTIAREHASIGGARRWSLALIGAADQGPDRHFENVPGRASRDFATISGIDADFPESFAARYA